MSIFSIYRYIGILNRTADVVHYLNDRRQRVVLNGVATEWASVTNRVPQGSVLGSLLFIIFVNELPDVAEHRTLNMHELGQKEGEWSIESNALLKSITVACGRKPQVN